MRQSLLICTETFPTDRLQRDEAIAIIKLPAKR